MSLGTLFLSFAVLFWGGSFVATKILVGCLPVTEIIALRLLIAVPPMAIAASLLKAWPRKLTAKEWWLLAGASMVLLLHWSVQFNGIRWTTATNSGWMVGAAPLSISFFAAIFLGERIRLRQIAGMAIASAGIVLLVSRGDLSTLDWLANRGDWLVLSSILIWGIYTAMTRDISRRHHPLGITTIITAFCGTPPVLFALMRGNGSSVAALTGEGVGAILFLALGSTFFALWFWQEGVARQGASRAGYFLYLLPLVTTAVSVPYLGEEFGGGGAVGGALILAGVILAEGKNGKKGKIG